jgi:hypothetical protein
MHEPQIKKSPEAATQASARPRGMFWVLWGSIALAVIAGVLIMGGYWDGLWN